MSSEYKGYLIVGDGSFGYKHIKPKGKGSVAKELRGSYTTSGFAKSAIDAYVSKVGENGKAKSSNGS